MATITSTNTRNMLPGIVGQPRNVNSPYHYEKHDTTTLGNNIAGLGNTFGKLAINLSAGARQRRDDDLLLAIREYETLCNTWQTERTQGVNGKDWLTNGEQDWLDAQNKFRATIRANYDNIDFDEFNKRVRTIDIRYNTSARTSIHAATNKNTQNAIVAADATALDEFNSSGDLDAYVNAVSANVLRSSNIDFENLNKKYEMFAGIDTSDIDMEKQEDFEKFVSRLREVKEVTIGDKVYKVVEDNDTKTREGVAQVISREELLNQAAAYRQFYVDKNNVELAAIDEKCTEAVTKYVEAQVKNGNFDAARKMLANAARVAGERGVKFDGEKFEEQRFAVAKGEFQKAGADAAAVMCNLIPDKRGFVNEAELAKLTEKANEIKTQMDAETDVVKKAFYEAQINYIGNACKTYLASITRAEAENYNRVKADWQARIKAGEDPMSAYNAIAINEDTSRGYCVQKLYADAKNLAGIKESVTANENASAALAQTREFVKYVEGEQQRQKAEKQAINDEVARELTENVKKLDTARDTANAEEAKKLRTGVEEIGRAFAGLNRGSKYYQEFTQFVEQALAQDTASGENLTAIQAYLIAKGEDPDSYIPGNAQSKEHLLALIKDDKQYGLEHPAAEPRSQVMQSVANASSGRLLGRLKHYTEQYNLAISGTNTQHSQAVEQLKIDAEQKASLKQAEYNKKNGKRLDAKLFRMTSRGQMITANINSSPQRNATIDARNGLVDSKYIYANASEVTLQLLKNGLCEGMHDGYVTLFNTGDENQDLQLPCRSEEDIRQVCAILGVAREDDVNDVVKFVKTHGENIRIVENALYTIAGEYSKDFLQYDVKQVASVNPWFIAEIAEQVNQARMTFAGSGDKEAKLNEVAYAALISRFSMVRTGKGKVKEGDNTAQWSTWSLESMDVGSGILGMNIQVQETYDNALDAMLGTLKNAANGDVTLGGNLVLGQNATEAGQALIKNGQMLYQYTDEKGIANENHTKNAGIVIDNGR